MNKKLLYLLVMIAVLLLVTACGGEGEVESAAAEEHQDEHMDDHGMEHIHVDPPDEFASLANPEAGHDEAIAAGKELYTTNCLTCHGPEGKGDGEGAVNLDPKPANLADGGMMAGLSDGYLFWRISKGGAFEPFNSAMPAWEQTFSEGQRWQLVSFVRSLSEDAEHMDEDMHMEEEMHEEGDQHEGEDQHMEGDEHEESEHNE